MLAAADSDSAPEVRITRIITQAKPLHDPLHHAQVVEDGDEAREEDDGGQHLEGEEVLEEVLAEDEDRAAVGEVEEPGDGVAHGVEERRAPSWCAG